MSHSDDKSTSHAAEKLLPWYANGTLTESERREVDDHVAACPDCRRELEYLSGLSATLKQAFAGEPMPMLRIRSSVMAQVRADRERLPAASPAGSNGGFGSAVEQWFRNLFAPRWVPAVVAVLLLGQLTLLLWTAGHQTPAGTNEVTTRGLRGESVLVAVVFQDSAPEVRIRSAIRTLRGRIVDGPTPDGRYTIEVPATLAVNLDDQLVKLREQPGLVRLAERLSQ
jgi:anti-sigma factor RsiW